MRPSRAFRKRRSLRETLAFVHLNREQRSIVPHQTSYRSQVQVVAGCRFSFLALLLARPDLSFLAYHNYRHCLALRVGWNLLVLCRARNTDGKYQRHCGTLRIASGFGNPWASCSSCCFRHRKSSWRRNRSVTRRDPCWWCCCCSGWKDFSGLHGLLLLGDRGHRLFGLSFPRWIDRQPFQSWNAFVWPSFCRRYDIHGLQWRHKWLANSTPNFGS
mmetsp:Transcript_14610/g.33830  ORF Transcript_14610/g.33830 Transcript_14610/m.33830 type:complete len:216 (-) Transcript_14610:2428-3075(-)